MLRAIVALALLASPALAQDAPRQPDYQAVAGDFRVQLQAASDRAAVCASDLAQVRRDLADATKPKDQPK